MKPKTDLDYVELYAENIRVDPKLFAEQKRLIESQLKSSSDMFKNMCGTSEFKVEARKYLKEVGILK